MVNYKQDNLINRVFDYQDLTGSTFDRCNLEYCSFKDCIMKDVTFDRCNCMYCNWDGVNMREINFINTNIINPEDPNEE